MAALKSGYFDFCFLAVGGSGDSAALFVSLDGSPLSAVAAADSLRPSALPAAPSNLSLLSLILEDPQAPSS